MRISPAAAFGVQIEPHLTALFRAAYRLTGNVDDPRVHAALELLSQRDASERVREEAAVALLSEAELNAMLKARIVDAALPAGERMRALMNPFGDMRFGFDGSVPIDAEVADALISIASDPANAESDRARAVSFLRQAGTPRATDAHLERGSRWQTPLTTIPTEPCATLSC